MQLVELRETGPIEAFLRHDTALHVYALADLDPRFWPLTRWFGLRSADGLQTVAFVFTVPSASPVLYAVCQPGDAPTRCLLGLLGPHLPPEFQAHIGVGLEDDVPSWFARGHARYNYKMALETCGFPSATAAVCARLTPSDAEEVGAFYRHRAYAPGEELGRYFAPYMLEIGPFCGVRENGRLVAAGGFHVNSALRRVAALGNVATAPEARGRGHAHRVTAALCTAVRHDVDVIGLNVAVDNTAAIRLYESLGFGVVGRFVDLRFSRREALAQTCTTAC